MQGLGPTSTSGESRMFGSGSRKWFYWIFVSRNPIIIQTKWLKKWTLIRILKSIKEATKVVGQLTLGPKRFLDRDESIQKTESDYCVGGGSSYLNNNGLCDVAASNAEWRLPDYECVEEIIGLTSDDAVRWASAIHSHRLNCNSVTWTDFAARIILVFPIIYQLPYECYL